MNNSLDPPLVGRIDTIFEGKLWVYVPGRGQEVWLEKDCEPHNPPTK